MHISFSIAIGIVLLTLIIIKLCRCECGCYKWCGCAHVSIDDVADVPKCCCVRAVRAGEKFVNSTRTVTLHYTNWCHYCKQMKPVWNAVKSSTLANGIVFREVDEDVAKTPGITGYPTILMVDEHGKTSQYNGGSDMVSLRNWILAR